MNNLPDSVKVFDVTYSIEYVEKPSDVDIHGRTSCWGQVDYWTRTIRVYTGSGNAQEVWNTIWHETLHCIAEKLAIEEKGGKLCEDEPAINLLATGINSVLNDNKWMRKSLMK